MNRRQFAFALAAAPTLLPAEPATSRLVLVTKDEPGEPLIVTGTIYGADGKTPMPGAKLFVYHTDATGIYARPNNDPRLSRIKGWVQADQSGRYEIQTIRPASYPNTTISQHIHVFLSAPGAPEHWIDNYLFEGDKFLDQSDIAKNRSLGSFSAVMHMKRGSKGEWVGIRNIRLDRDLADRNRLQNGWYRT